MGNCSQGVRPHRTGCMRNGQIGSPMDSGSCFRTKNQEAEGC